MRIFAEVEIAFFGCFNELTRLFKNMVQQFALVLVTGGLPIQQFPAIFFLQVTPNKKIHGSQIRRYIQLTMNKDRSQ